MNIYQQFVSGNGLALVAVMAVAGFLTGCMTTASTPADYKQSVLAMQELQTLNPNAKDVPGAESILPIDGIYESQVIHIYRGAVSQPSEIRTAIDLDINTEN